MQRGSYCFCGWYVYGHGCFYDGLRRVAPGVHWIDYGICRINDGDGRRYDGDDGTYDGHDGSYDGVCWVNFGYDRWHDGNDGVNDGHGGWNACDGRTNDGDGWCYDAMVGLMMIMMTAMMAAMA